MGGGVVGFLHGCLVCRGWGHGGLNADDAVSFAEGTFHAIR